MHAVAYKGKSCEDNLATKKTEHSGSKVSYRVRSPSLEKREERGMGVHSGDKADGCRHVECHCAMCNTRVIERKTL